MNLYDGKAFVINTPSPGRSGNYDSGWLYPVDGSISPYRIMGWSFGGRYDLDSGTGKIEDSIPGPWVGPEIVEFIAKCGGVSGTLYPIAPYPGWSYMQYIGPKEVSGGPNAGPYYPASTAPAVLPPPVVEPPKASTVGTPVAAPSPAPVAPAPQPAPFPPSAPGSPMHMSLIARIKALLAELENHLGG